MFGQQMFGPSYFFRLLFSGQFKQKDRNCLLASSSESIVYSWKKWTLKELMSLWDKNCYFCFVFLWLWRTWTNGQISFVSSMVFKRMLIVFCWAQKNVYYLLITASTLGQKILFFFCFIFALLLWQKKRTDRQNSFVGSMLIRLAILIRSSSWSHISKSKHFLSTAGTFGQKCSLLFCFFPFCFGGQNERTDRTRLSAAC